MEIRTKSGGYSESFKIHVVGEIESGKISKSAARRKYDISGHSTVLKWCRKYGYNNYNQKVFNGGIMSNEADEIILLNNEIKALKQELEEVRMKNVVMDTFVDLAEKELGIPIRKKYGAKQSGK